MTLLYSDPLFLRHETGRHVEIPARLLSVTARLEKSGLAQKCRRPTYVPASPDEVAQVHNPGVIELARRVAGSGGGMLDADTVLSAESYQVALAAAGACADAAQAVLRGDDKTALCLVRPPGHHATPTHSMGFCLFNNIAVAAHRARTSFDLSRILIVDWDVHHGNGTQDIFWADPTVLFFSIHRYGMDFYPGTGAGDESGTGAGLGYTFNVPVRYGTTRKDYHALFARALEKAADKVRPELVLLSAGFDAHTRDPIGSLGLETEDFSALTRLVIDVARTHAAGRLVSCLEGGYHLEALAESVEAHLSELMEV